MMPIQLIRRFDGASKIFLELPRSGQNKLFKKYGVFTVDFFENANDRERKRKLFVLLYDHSISEQLILEIVKEGAKYGLQRTLIERPT